MMKEGHKDEVWHLESGCSNHTTRKKTLSLELVEAKKTFITLGIAQLLLLENEVFQLQHQLEGRQSMGCFMFLKCNKVC